MMRRAMRRRPAPTRLIALVAVIGATLATGVVLAAGPPTVNITDSGLDGDIPVGSPFYLAGTAEPGVTDVVPVFVRTGTRTMFGTTGESCAVFARTLGAFAGGAGGTSPIIVFSTPGQARASNVWAGGPGFHPDTPVFIPARWVAPAATSSAAPTASTPPAASSGGSSDQPAGPKSTAWQILVPQDPFFTTAGSYCLFMYKTKHTPHKDSATIKAALVKYPTEAVACSDAACLATARANFAGAKQAAVAPLPVAEQNTLIAAANQLIARAATLVTKPATAGALLYAFAQAGNAAPAVGSTLTLPLPAPAPMYAPYRSTKVPAPDPTDWLGVGVAQLLAEQGGLLVEPVGGVPAYFSKDASIQVKFLQLLADDETIQIASNPKAVSSKDPANAGMKASALTVGPMDPTGGFSTLRDLLEMLRGNLRVNGAYAPATAVRARLGTIMSTPDGALAGDDLTYFDSVRTRVQSLSDTIERLLAQAVLPPASAQSLGERALGKWLKGLLVPCAHGPLASWGIDDSMTPVCAGMGAVPDSNWPGYLAKGSNPLSFLASNSLDAYEKARAGWATAVDSVSFSVDHVTSLQSDFALNVQFTQSEWVFSYVTPITGAAFVVDGSSTFSLFYLGVQLHVVPNPVDTPQWTQPDDYMRAIALELGISTVGGSFGPDNRFSGWKGLPPIFVGGALHLVPYTSFSAGVTLLERRTSTVTQEQPQAWAGLYIGANVQANIPDLVVALKGRTSSTTTTPKAP